MLTFFGLGTAVQEEMSFKGFSIFFRSGGQFV